MKLLTFKKDGAEDFGVISETDGGVVALGERTGLADMTALIASGVEKAREFVGQPGDFGIDDIEFLPPVPRPEHLFAIGLNTYSHLEEAGRDRSEAPENPMVFIRFPSSVTGHLGDLEMPSDVTTFDYEGEIVLVIGEGGRNIPVESALDHVVGVSIFNDGSIREYQRHTTQVTPGKNFDSSGSFGPYLVTVDETGPLEDLELTTKVNGEQKQHLKTDDLIFPFAELIHYLSHSTTLVPGDVIVTGSPAGVAVFSPPYLVPGDEVEIDVPGVGTLVNKVVAVDPTPREA